MSNKTVLVVFPSLYSLNKINNLVTNISNILTIREQPFSKIRKADSVIVVEADDPVLASSAIGLLFGIDRIAIAKEVENNFDDVISTITKTAISLLLKGERFYIRVDGRAKSYLPKDLEVAATGSLIEKSVDLQLKPGSESNHDRLLYTYITESFAYVCIFVDKGMGGVPNKSQKVTILCCVHDELSAISCLQTIKLGFDVKILLCYHSESNLLKISKMISRILPRFIQKKIELQVCKLSRTSNMVTKNIIITHVMIAIASSRRLDRIALSISPLIFPSWFVELNAKIAFQKQTLAWFPLAGIDSSIIEAAKEIGLEKYLTNLEKLCKSRFSKKIISKSKLQKDVKEALRTLKSISITVGPKNVHDIIDSVKSNH